jgi:hypothetical protein
MLEVGFEFAIPVFELFFQTLLALDCAPTGVGTNPVCFEP